MAKRLYAWPELGEDLDSLEAKIAELLDTEAHARSLREGSGAGSGYYASLFLTEPSAKRVGDACRHMWGVSPDRSWPTHQGLVEWMRARRPTADALLAGEHVAKSSSASIDDVCDVLSTDHGALIRAAVSTLGYQWSGSCKWKALLRELSPCL